MNVKKELIVIRTLLNLTQSELAEKINVSYETINRWEQEKNDVEDYNVEKIYTFAFKNKIYLNQIYEQLLKENERDLVKILFHGCKKELKLPLDLEHSKVNNDFGKAFYMGENLKQASTYISNSNSAKVFAFELDLEKLKVKKFNVNKEWMLAIAYYRGWLEDYKNHPIITKIVNEIEKNDIIIAPIADNKMFDLISEFVRGEITDMQCQHALAATNLGMQYVIRTKKALDQISFNHLFYISQIEKQTLISERLDLNNICQDKVKVARISFRGKGQYIDELLK